MTPARGPGGLNGFNVAVGGKMGSGGMTVAQPLDVFVELQDAARLASAITLLFRDAGSREKRTRARLAFLVDDWGVDRFRKELEERWGAPLAPAGKDARYDHDADHLGVNPQRQEGLYSVGVRSHDAPCADDTGGNWPTCRCLGSGASGDRGPERDHPMLPRPTCLRSDEPLLPAVSEPGPHMRGLVSCNGNDYCNLALIETKSVSRRVIEALDSLHPDAGPLRMYWSGCPAGCGNHHAADIGFQGGKTRYEGEVVDAVTIFAGGKTGPDARAARKIVDQVPVSTLGKFLPGLIAKLKGNKFDPNIDLTETDMPGIDFES